MWDDEIKAQAAALKEEGLTFTEIAEKINVPYSTVRIWLIAEGEAEFKTDYPKLRARAIEMRLQGYGHTKIADHMKLGDMRVRKWLSDAEKNGTVFPPVRRRAGEINMRLAAPKPKQTVAAPTPPTPPMTQQTSLVLAEEIAQHNAQNTVSERLQAARSRAGTLSITTSQVQSPASLEATLELERLRARIEALRIERDALREVIDKMQGDED